VSNNDLGVEVTTGCIATVHDAAALGNVIGYVSFGGKLSVDHRVAAGGTTGVLITGLTGDVSVTDCTIANNSSDGITVRTSGTGRLTRNTITRNGIGIDNISGTVHSAGDNVVDGNTMETSGTITAANKA